MSKRCKNYVLQQNIFACACLYSLIKLYSFFCDCSILLHVAMRNVGYIVSVMYVYISVYTIYGYTSIVWVRRICIDNSRCIISEEVMEANYFGASFGHKRFGTNYL